MSEDEEQPICGICEEPVVKAPLSCKGCEAVYHRSCRLGTGHCLTEGCKRSRPLELGADVERNRSALQADVTPWIFGFFMALILTGPILFGFKLPLLSAPFIIMALTLVLGGIKARLS